MRIAEVILAAALLGTYFVGWAAADVTDSQAYVLIPEAREELIAFVKEARDLALKEGRDKALEVFNDPNGEFVRGDLYIFAHDFNGTCLASPNEPETIGKNELNSTDPNGVPLGRNMLEAAKRGGGFSYYIWPNPAHSDAQELKLAYVLKADEGLWLGAGVFLNGSAPIFSNESREDLVAFVERAREFALNSTRDAALLAFNDREGEFVRGNRYIFAYDFQGNTLALPFQPELIGTNRLDHQDPNGMLSVQAILDTAKMEGGFAYLITKDPAENMTQRLKLDYSVPVDDEWFLGSGIYWPRVSD